uniref:Uncharacterized protein n=1 Tax=Rhizophora mucronata TaxID=61149 RepID=A0A2P2IKI6_RHIMU
MTFLKFSGLAEPVSKEESFNVVLLFTVSSLHSPEILALE